MEWLGPTRPDWLLPAATKEAVARHREWLAPQFVDERNRFVMAIQTFVVEAPGLTVLVDTCLGNDKPRANPQWNMLRTTFLADLEAAGFPPSAINVVVCTHLHVDHVGWNTRLADGRWVPTFPRARYLFARREWEHWAKLDSDRGYVLELGRNRFEGTGQDLLQNPEVRRLYLGGEVRPPRAGIADASST